MKAITKFLNRNTKEVSWDKNTYEPKQLKIEKTIYPNWQKGDNGHPIISQNGTGEFYGLQEGTLNK